MKVNETLNQPETKRVFPLRRAERAGKEPTERSRGDKYIENNVMKMSLMAGGPLFLSTRRSLFVNVFGRSVPSLRESHFFAKNLSSFEQMSLPEH